jgi:hypothetical protein
MTARECSGDQVPADESRSTNNQQLHYRENPLPTPTMLTQPEPLIHIPIYCWANASDYAMRAMVQQVLACVQSYFAHENTYALLITTNDRRPFEILSAYQRKTGYGFQLEFVTQDDLLDAFNTDLYHLADIPSTRTIFSKFYPILKRVAGAIVHVDFDTIFASQIDLTPLLVSDIGLVDANQFMAEPQRWEPNESETEFFRLSESGKPSWNWINSGVFSVQRRGFEILAGEVAHYLENLKRVIDDGIHIFTDEIIMNALAIRERDAVAVIPDYRLHFLHYYLKDDPLWTTRAGIIHFHALKADRFWYRDGVLTHRRDIAENKILMSRINQDLYLAVLMWYRHLHAACEGLPYLFPLLEAVHLDVAEREIAARLGRARAGFRGSP